VKIKIKREKLQRQIHMLMNERYDPVATCGMDRGVCEPYACRDNHKLFNRLVERRMLKDKRPCDGCRAVKGNCPVIGGACETYGCASENKVEFCFDCDKFPCERLDPAANRAGILPHNLKVFSLCTIKRIGLDTFVDKSPEIKRRYSSARWQ